MLVKRNGDEPYTVEVLDVDTVNLNTKKIYKTKLKAGTPIEFRK